MAIKQSYETFLFAAVALLTSCGTVAESTQQVSIQEVVSAVKTELMIAANTEGPSAGLSLTSVEISLSISQSKAADGSVSIGVPLLGATAGISGAYSDAEASQITVRLDPPKPSPLMSSRLKQLKSAGIATAIVQIREQLVAGLNDEPKLIPTSVEYELSFYLEQTGSPSAKFSFGVISAEGRQDWSRNESNKITLVFSRVSAP